MCTSQRIGCVTSPKLIFYIERKAKQTHIIPLTDHSYDTLLKRTAKKKLINIVSQNIGEGGREVIYIKQGLIEVFLYNKFVHLPFN